MWHCWRVWKCQTTGTEGNGPGSKTQDNRDGRCDAHDDKRNVRDAEVTKVGVSAEEEEGARGREREKEEGREERDKEEMGRESERGAW